MTNRVNEYAPNYLVLPGDHIVELLEVHGMSQKELAWRIGVTPKHINTVIKGGARITPEFAHSLGIIFDYPAEMWLNFQSAYDISALKRKKEEELEKHAEFLSEFDYNDLVKAEYVPYVERIAEKINHLLRFFRVATVDACRNNWFGESTLFRITDDKAIKRGNIAAWIRYGQIVADRSVKEYPCYDKGLFVKALEKIKLLTVNSDTQSEMVELCKNAGVVLLFVSELPRTEISGAAYWVNNKKTPCIQMPLHIKTNDHFRFTFYQEAYHILEHHEKKMFMDLSSGEKDETGQLAGVYASDNFESLWLSVSEKQF
jgi:HTH-type transcriptional regulator/antitoxin HigA